MRSEANAVSDRTRILVYLAFAFGLAWALWFAVVYPLFNAANETFAVLVQLAVALGMFAPALAVLLTRLVTREGFSDTWIAPRDFRRTWKYYVLGWFGPLVLVVAGAALYFIVFPQDFDPTMSLVIETSRQSAAAMGESAAVDDATVRTGLLVSLFIVPLAPALNFVTCFGEEWGWRGYLLPKMLAGHSVTFTMITCGVIWGLWHAPITILGHNYGLGYMGYPVTGILAMCIFTTVCGVFLSYVTIKSGSCMPAIFAHGMINGVASAGLMFSATGGNPFVGPAPTGVIGGAFFIVVAVVLFALLLKLERQGNLRAMFEPKTSFQGAQTNVQAGGVR